jgi:hypothetical protein
MKIAIISKSQLCVFNVEKWYIANLDDSAQREPTVFYEKISHQEFSVGSCVPVHGNTMLILTCSHTPSIENYGKIMKKHF